MLRGQVTFASEKGPRIYQEDRFLVLKPRIEKDFSGWLLAIMDGHGGSSVSEFCFYNLPGAFERASNAGRGKVNEEVLAEAIRWLVKQMRKDFCKSAIFSGSTLSLVYVDELALIARVAVLGDSPIIIKDSSGKVVVSPEHNVRTNLAEREAAVKRGAVYFRNSVGVGFSDYGLQLSRALGDYVLESILSREPETYSINLGPESFVLVASNGLLDPGHKNPKPLTDSVVASVVAQIEKGATAVDLVKDAISVRATRDNVTAVLWRPLKLKQAQAGQTGE